MPISAVAEHGAAHTAYSTTSNPRPRHPPRAVAWSLARSTRPDEFHFDPFSYDVAAVATGQQRHDRRRFAVPARSQHNAILGPIHGAVLYSIPWSRRRGGNGILGRGIIEMPVRRMPTARTLRAAHPGALVARPSSRRQSAPSYHPCQNIFHSDPVSLTNLTEILEGVGTNKYSSIRRGSTAFPTPPIANLCRACTHQRRILRAGPTTPRFPSCKIPRPACSPQIRGTDWRC